MTKTSTVLDTSVYSPFNHLTPLLAREYLIEFSYGGIFKFYVSVLFKDLFPNSQKTLCLHRKDQQVSV